MADETTFPELDIVRTFDASRELVRAAQRQALLTR
jgi:hypothetical protein